MKRVLLAGLVGLLAAAPASANIVINVGTGHTVQPNTQIQAVPIIISATSPTGDKVTGFNLRAQIGDGMGGSPEPIFHSIDFLGTSTDPDTPMIWNAFAATTGGGPANGQEQMAQASITFNVSGQQVESTGAVALLYIDTTGFQSGTYDLKLSATQIGVDSAFIGPGASIMFPEITNGSFTIAPEPASALLFAAGGGLLIARRRRAS